VGKILVLGLGNTLLQDEGIGVRVIERLQEDYEFPEDVQVLDGGTRGLTLLSYFEGVSKLLIVDAVKAGKEPGTLIRLEGEEIPAFFSPKISPHQEGLPDLLFTARLLNLYPQEVVLWGIEPLSLEPGLELSPLLASKVKELVEKVVEELHRWGVKPRKKSEVAELT